MVRYVIRNAVADDFQGLFELAKMLNTVNLPNDPLALQEVLTLSIQSFNGQISNPFDREYLFVLEDRVAKKIVGSSQIIAQHGTREMPHLFFEVGMSEKYSNTVDKHFKHQVLRLGSNYEGPTEIGGLIVDRDYRHAPEKLGRQLSLVRFLFIAMNRTQFRDRVLAELLPPFLQGRQSLLWECLGRRFTGLGYHEADHFSRTNKEFITNLFPRGEIYTCLFSDEVQRVIGAVGPESMPAKKLLESIGFSYQSRVDPFDGGPHFEADCEKIEPIRNSQLLKVAECHWNEQPKSLWLVASLKGAFTKDVDFRSAFICGELDKASQSLRCTSETLIELGIDSGSHITAYPLALPD